MSRRFLTPVNVLHLASAPSSASTGDLYFNTTEDLLYTFNGTTWVVSSGLQGVTGLQGTDGTQGVQGIEGAQGIAGLQGTQGIQGTSGSALIEIDGGSATSVYGGITSIDAGTATG
jgi:hypothetical protein